MNELSKRRKLERMQEMKRTEKMRVEAPKVTSQKLQTAVQSVTTSNMRSVETKPFAKSNGVRDDNNSSNKIIKKMIVEKKKQSEDIQLPIQRPVQAVARPKPKPSFSDMLELAKQNVLDQPLKKRPFEDLLPCASSSVYRKMHNSASQPDTNVTQKQCGSDALSTKKSLPATDKHSEYKNKSIRITDAENANARCAPLAAKQRSNQSNDRQRASTFPIQSINNSKKAPTPSETRDSRDKQQTARDSSFPSKQQKITKFPNASTISGSSSNTSVNSQKLNQTQIPSGVTKHSRSNAPDAPSLSHRSKEKVKNNVPDHKHASSKTFPSSSSSKMISSTSKPPSVPNQLKPRDPDCRINSTNGPLAPAPRGIAAQLRSLPSIRGSQRREDYSDGYSDDDDDDDRYASDDSFIDDSAAVQSHEYARVVRDIHKALKFDPRKYKEISAFDDCRTMEASYREIEKEERRR